MSHNVPMQIIQQTPISIPPPSGIRSQPIVQLQSLQQANQQPANIQITNGQQVREKFT